MLYDISIDYDQHLNTTEYSVIVAHLLGKHNRSSNRIGNNKIKDLQQCLQCGRDARSKIYNNAFNVAGMQDQSWQLVMKTR